MNISTDPCIKVLTRRHAIEHVSFTDVILRAREFLSFFGDVALSHSLVNLTAAAISHIYKIRKEQDLVDLWQEESFDSDLVKKYFRRHSANFELFKSPKNGIPFLQPCPRSYLERPEDFWPITGLIDQLPSNNNKVFNCSVDLTSQVFSALSPQRAFEALAQYQFFSPGHGGKPNARLHKKVPHRSCPPWMYYGDFQPIGDTLYETLLLNVDIPSLLKSDDLPSWAITSEFPIPSKNPITSTGPLMRATFPHHWVLLVPPTEEDQQVRWYTHPSSYQQDKQIMPTQITITREDKVDGYCPNFDNWTKRHLLISQKTNKRETVTPPKRIVFARNRCSKKVMGISMFYGRTDKQRTSITVAISDKFCLPTNPPKDLFGILEVIDDLTEKIRRTLDIELRDEFMSICMTKFEDIYLELIQNDTFDPKIVDQWKSFIGHTASSLMETSWREGNVSYTKNRRKKIRFFKTSLSKILGLGWWKTEKKR